MNKNSVLKREIKNMYGNVLGIGNINDKVVEHLYNNQNITICNILSKNTYNGDEKNSSKLKKISLSNLRKFKKKRINFLIVDYDIEKYIKTFIKDSIYITNNYIYFCTKDKNKIKKLYSRYNISLKEVKCSDTYILIIDVKKAKNNYIKELIYSIVDFIEKIGEIITELLLN